MAENRWFQIVATGDPVVFFGDDSPIPPPAAGEPAVVTVQLDGQASAAEFGAWTLDSVSVFCADPRHTVTYFADPGMGRDTVELSDISAFGREPGRDLTDAPAGLRDLLTHLVAFEPAALATRLAQVRTEPGWVRAPLIEHTAGTLHTADCVATIPCFEHVEELVDGALAVLVQQLPARPVRLTVTAADPVDSRDSPADETPADCRAGTG